MNIDQAYIQMSAGHKVKHTSFSNNEFIQIKDFKILDEAGYDFEDAWLARKDDPAFFEGWSLYEDSDIKIESERKFFLDSNPIIMSQLLNDGFCYKTEYLQQAYLSIEKDIRLRKSIDISSKDTKVEFCCKGKGDMDRPEMEYPIMGDPFRNNIISTFTEGKLIRKIRLYVNPNVLKDGVKATVDIYLDDLIGLMVVELEKIKGSNIDLRFIYLPDFVGEEITGNVIFKNASLASELYDVQQYITSEDIKTASNFIASISLSIGGIE